MSLGPQAGGIATALGDLNESLPAPRVAAAIAGEVDAGRGPDAVLVAMSYDGRDVAARLSARLDRPVLTNAIGLSTAEGDGAAPLVTEHAAFGDTEIVRARFSGAGPAIVAVQPKAVAAEHFSGACAASRAIVDAGWVSYAYQVGQTGKTVKPAGYLMCGISGATQHLVGMNGSSHVTAINKDPEAPIFSVADLGVVGDVTAVLPQLTAAPSACRNRRHLLESPRGSAGDDISARCGRGGRDRRTTVRLARHAPDGMGRSLLNVSPVARGFVRPERDPAACGSQNR